MITSEVYRNCKWKGFISFQCTFNSKTAALFKTKTVNNEQSYNQISAAPTIFTLKHETIKVWE